MGQAMLYSAYEPLVSHARARSEIWRLGLGLALIAALFYALNTGYFWTIRAILDPAAWKALGTELGQGSTPRAVTIMLFNFLALTLAIAIVLPILHRRSLFSLVGPLTAVLRDFGKVLVVLAAVNVAFWFLPWPGKIAASPNLDPVVWRAWMPLALIGVFLQTSTEELLFRGYIQSQLAARFGSVLIWLLFPSLVFAALHFDPATFGPNAKWVALWAGLFAFAAADVTARAGNLGPAFAMHLMNNTGAILINAVAGNWDGLALQTLPIDPQATETFKGVILAEAGLILASWLMARLAIRR